MIRVPTDREPQHPGEVLLQDYLQPLAMPQTQLANALGITHARLNELVHGRRGMMVDTALRLERFFGVSAQSWLNAQLRWDLYHSTHAPKAMKALATTPPAPR